MKPCALGVIALICFFLAIGCHRSSSSPVTSAPDQPTAKTPLLGRWTSSTAPEMASSRATMAFLESGEYQYNAPMMLFGKPVTAKVDGKDVAARLIASGTWKLDGDQLRVQITQCNQPAVEFNEPWVYKVINSSDKKLELEKDGKLIALFREE